jgi:peptidoglycan hydrolase CwlO-like protein
MSDECKAERQSDIPLALNELTCAVASLESDLDNLSQRLVSISKSVLEEEVPREQPQESVCELSGKIRELKDQVRHQASKVKAQISALEI